MGCGVFGAPTVARGRASMPPTCVRPAPGVGSVLRGVPRYARRNGSTERLPTRLIPPTEGAFCKPSSQRHDRSDSCAPPRKPRACRGSLTSSREMSSPACASDGACPSSPNRSTPRLLLRRWDSPRNRSAARRSVCGHETRPWRGARPGSRAGLVGGDVRAPRRAGHDRRSRDPEVDRGAARVRPRVGSAPHGPDAAPIEGDTPR